MTADIPALAQALAEARAAEVRARQDREEVLSEPAFKPAFEADAVARLAIQNARNYAAVIENDVRLAIEQHYAETGEGPGIDGLGLQWRSEPAYDDQDARAWIVNVANDDGREVVDALVRSWLYQAIAKLRPALNKILLEVRPDFADCTSKRLVPTISANLGAKLEAAANPPPESMAEWQTRDRRERGEAISKLVAEQWGEKP